MSQRTAINYNQRCNSEFLVRISLIILYCSFHNGCKHDINIRDLNQDRTTFNGTTLVDYSVKRVHCELLIPYTKFVLIDKIPCEINKTK